MRIFLASETLGFRRAGFSPALSLLMPASSLLRRPAALTVDLLPAQNAPLPLNIRSIRDFGIKLEPRKSSAQDRSTSELLRTL